MNQEISIRNQFCGNKNCVFYGETMKGNIVIHGRNPSRVRCNACKKTWGQRKNTALFGLKTNERKVRCALHMLQQGNSVRATAEHFSVSPSTILRWKQKFKIIH